MTEIEKAVKKGILTWLQDPDVGREDELAGDFKELFECIMHHIKDVSTEPSLDILNEWACGVEYGDLDKKAEAFSKSGELSVFTPNSAARGFYVGWIFGQKGLKESGHV